MKLYNIESHGTYWGEEYRYRSLYNGAVGSWCSRREEAEKYGEKHQKVILTLHGKESLSEVSDATNGKSCENV